ncbi:hypothetical protein GOODEAATRI_034297 [Goodea atripinnis]|uniref:Uncharacterized protein n=1 Tax=Goodea atripinnis TaxID=208336 RepID=A0ABV0P9Y2_9TELE
MPAGHQDSCPPLGHLHCTEGSILSSRALLQQYQGEVEHRCKVVVPHRGGGGIAPYQPQARREKTLGEEGDNIRVLPSRTGEATAPLTARDTMQHGGGHILSASLGP